MSYRSYLRKKLSTRSVSEAKSSYLFFGGNSADRGISREEKHLPDQSAATDSNGSCFLLEITRFAHQMNCFTGHGIYLWIFLDAGKILLSDSPLRSGDRLMRTRRRRLTKRMVCDSNP